MTNDDFSLEIDRLHNAFGAAPGMARASKVIEWYELWQRFYANTSPMILKGMVDQAVKKYDRLPSFAQFSSLRAQVLGSGPVQSYPKFPCDKCGGTGQLSVQRVVEGYGKAWFAYRCDRCENWRGAYDGLPMIGP